LAWFAGAALHIARDLVGDAHVAGHEGGRRDAERCGDRKDLRHVRDMLAGFYLGQARDRDADFVGELPQRESRGLTFPAHPLAEPKVFVLKQMRAVHWHRAAPWQLARFSHLTTKTMLNLAYSCLTGCVAEE